MDLLLLDVSFGFFDLVFMNPFTFLLAGALGLLLVYLGVRAIRRELAKKKGQEPEGLMIESESPETEPLPETVQQAAAAPGEAAGPSREETAAPETPQDEK